RRLHARRDPLLARRDLPLRGPGDDFRGRITVLSLSVPRGTAGRNGPRLCDDGRARHAPRRDRDDTGDRDGKIVDEYRRAPRRPTALLRRAGDEFRGTPAQGGPRLSGLRGE